jgi:FixJ family two-component response regulator
LVEDGAEIYVVDDEPLVRDTIVAMLTAAGYRAVCFSDGVGLIAQLNIRAPVCVFLDVGIPGMSGLDVLREIRASRDGVPIFMISGHADIPMAVEAMRQGATSFIEKPFRARQILDCVEIALGSTASRAAPQSPAGAMAFSFPGREPLTARERDVLELLVGGCSNKEVARRLDISPRTAEDHRARIMKKLGARNIADLVRMAHGG